MRKKKVYNTFLAAFSDHFILYTDDDAEYWYKPFSKFLSLIIEIPTSNNDAGIYLVDACEKSRLLELVKHLDNKNCAEPLLSGVEKYYENESLRLMVKALNRFCEEHKDSESDFSTIKKELKKCLS